MPALFQYTCEYYSTVILVVTHDARDIETPCPQTTSGNKRTPFNAHHSADGLSVGAFGFRPQSSLRGLHLFQVSDKLLSPSAAMTERCCKTPSRPLQAAAIVAETELRTQGGCSVNVICTKHKGHHSAKVTPRILSGGVTKCNIVIQIKTQIASSEKNMTVFIKKKNRTVSGQH